MSAMYDGHGEDKSPRWRSFIIQGVKGMNIPLKVYLQQCFREVRVDKGFFL